MTAFGQLPWNLWGSEEVITVVAGVPAATPSVPVSRPLARVTYKRPETFGFFFAAEIISPAEAPASGLTVQVNHNVNIGVGRSNWRSQGIRNLDYDTLGPEQAFVKFVWAFAAGELTRLRARKWASTAYSPALDDNAAPYQQSQLRWVTAQDIQHDVSVAAICPAAPQEVILNVSAFFAPLSHIRPDWWRDVQGARKQSDEEAVRFAGNEFEGT